MKIFHLALAGGAALLGYTLFLKDRFLGDDAKVGDMVTVPTSVLGDLGASAAAASPTALGAVVQVTYTDKDTLGGTVVGLTFAVNGTVQPVPGAGTVAFARSAVLGITRNGKAVT